MLKSVQMRQIKVDLTGKQFGEWSVLGIEYITRGERVIGRWRCRCKCGSIKLVNGTDLKTGKSIRCRTCYAIAQRKDDTSMVNKTYGIYSVVSVVKDVGVQKYGICVCILCGSESNVRIQSLKRNPKYCPYCPEQVSKQVQKGSKSWNWRGYGSVPGWYWGRLSEQSGRRRIQFTVTIRDAADKLQEQNYTCALSGQPLVFGFGNGKRKSTTASLDRIDSTKGYISGNIQWVHKTVNRMKSDFTQDGFIEFCAMVSVHTGRTKLVRDTDL